MAPETQKYRYNIRAKPKYFGVWTRKSVTFSDERAVFLKKKKKLNDKSYSIQWTAIGVNKIFFFILYS